AGEGGDPSIEDQLEIFSWWTSGGEAAALNALIDVFREDYPSTFVTNAAAGDPSNARERLQTRLDEGDPPDTFQAVSGVNVQSHITSGKLQAIDDLASELGLPTAFPDEVMKTVSHEGQLYAVPLNIERDNNVYYNKAVLAASSVTPPTTLQEFYDACVTLQADDVTPLSIAPAGWVLALTAFENLMPAVNGGDFYMKYFAGDADLSAGSADRAQLEALFTELDKVLACSDIAEASSSSWTLAMDELLDGTAAMSVMGDWAKGYLAQGSWTAGVDFDVVPGLGSSGYYVFNSAAFPLPENAPHPNAAKAFLSVMASEAGQLAFNMEKGAIPARLGVSLDDFDAMTQSSAQDYAAAAEGTNKLLPGYASMSSYDFQSEINDALLIFALGGDAAGKWISVTSGEESIVQGDVTYIVNVIAANYDQM
ncbi:MAG TPA: extracellular solute-binding protein, partial [Polyangiaceae bacterium]|nr:extracellular solute-binding protein [Polyangiaceae bacterium]